MPAQKIRLDTLLVNRGCFADRDSAARAILAGEVTSPALSNIKPGMLVMPDEELLVKRQKSFVSRGGEKLAAAIFGFQINVSGKRCLDIGAGSGGFTDCLLQNEAASVTAVDVGYGQFDYRLRNDPRVILLERTNFRNMALPDSATGDAFDLAVVDLSFTKTSSLLRRIRQFLTADGELIALIKPQFELPDSLRDNPGFVNGVVVDPTLHNLVLSDFLTSVDNAGLKTRGLIPSPIKGADGNVEFLLWATVGGVEERVDVREVLSQV